MPVDTPQRYVCSTETTRSVYKVAQCLDCGWSVTSMQTNQPSYVAQNAREHARTTRHTVEVTSTRTTTYTPIEN